MKKGLFLLVTLLCVTFLLIGCGGGSNGSTPSGNGNTPTDKLNERREAVTALQQVAKNAESATQTTGAPAPAMFSILAKGEPEGEEPGGEHGPKWQGPDAEGWYSITGYYTIFESHVLKVKMKFPDDVTTMYKHEDTVTRPDRSELGIGTEETTFTKGSDNLISGTSKYTRFYLFPNPENPTGRMTEYQAVAEQTFTNFSSDGTGHYETKLHLISTAYNFEGTPIINDRKYEQTLDIAFNADKTKLHASGTIQDVTIPGSGSPASPYEQDWDLITPAN
jgi:hypothetical protein